MFRGPRLKTPAVKYKHCSLRQHKSFFPMIKKPLYLLCILPISILCRSVLSASAPARNENVIGMSILKSTCKPPKTKWTQELGPRSLDFRESTKKYFKRRWELHGDPTKKTEGKRLKQQQQQLRGGLQVHQRGPWVLNAPCGPSAEGKADTHQNAPRV